MPMNLSNTKDMFERVLFSNVMTKNSTLLFTIEQWELTRRLKNSGLSKEQLCQAFDDIEKMERDLGSIYNIPVNNNTNSFIQNNNNMSGSPSSSSSTSSSTTSSSHSSHSSNRQNFFTNTNTSNKPVQPVDLTLNNGNASDPASVVNAYFATQIDQEIENRQIEEFRSKGEVLIHSEISFFVYKHDLKQSQISRMAGVNQAYVSKFLRGEFFDLSENGKTLIYKWYLRFSKSPLIYLQAHNIVLTSSSDKLLLNTANSGNSSMASASLLTNSNENNINNNITHLSVGSSGENTSFLNIASSNANSAASSFINSFHHDVKGASVAAGVSSLNSKRTRFSFKPEHLVILEKCFLDSQYPDQKKREELAKLCNEARLCPDREKVTEQIITHWFQNKRKITRKSNEDQQSSTFSYSVGRRAKNINNINKSSSSSSSYQDFIQDAQLAAFKSILDHKSNEEEDDNDDDDDDDEENNNDDDDDNEEGGEGNLF